MTEVNREVAEAVWKAHNDGKSCPQIVTLTGLSQTSVSRLIRTRKAMERGQLDNEIVKKTGWSVGRVAQVRRWWIDSHASQEQKPSPEHEEGRAGLEEVPERGAERRPAVVLTEVETGIRVETPVRYYKAPPWPPLYPGAGRACTWVLDVHLTNPSKILPIGIRNITLEVTRGDETHSLPHLGNSTAGSDGAVLFHEAALPVAVRLAPVETLSGKLRFFEWSGFEEGRVRLDLVLEEADGQIHRHEVTAFFDIPPGK